MKKLFLFICFLWVSAGGAFPQQPDGVGNLNETLRAIREKDQGIRLQTASALKNQNLDSLILLMQQSALIDAENQRVVFEILADGWPENLSDTANSAIFLVIQHADVARQKEFREIVKEAAYGGKLPKSSWAALEDRVLMRDNKKQLYGTQTKMFQAFPEGTQVCYIWPIEDVENVDIRREEIGLPPMEEYILKVETFYGLKVIWDKTLSVEALLEREQQ